MNKTQGSGSDLVARLCDTAGVTDTVMTTCVDTSVVTRCVISLHILTCPHVCCGLEINCKPPV